MQFPSLPLSLLVITCAALAGCASRSKEPVPRPATIVEVRDPESGFEKVRVRMQAGRAAVLGGVIRHNENGGSMRPWSIGPKVGELVEEGKAGVDDGCTRYVTLRFDQTDRDVRLLRRCNEQYTPGQRVRVTMTPGRSVDTRDAVRIDPIVE